MIDKATGEESVEVTSYYSKNGEYIQFLNDGTVLRYSGDAQRWHIDKDTKKHRSQILERMLVWHMD